VSNEVHAAKDSFLESEARDVGTLQSGSCLVRRKKKLMLRRCIVPMERLALRYTASGQPK
jgi:hypothetical protein